METTLLNRITVNPKVLAGKPVVRGMRISVEHVLLMLARGISSEEILSEYSSLTLEDIRACILFASQKVNTPDLEQLNENQFAEA